MTAADLSPAVQALYPFAPKDFAALSGRMSYVDHGPRDGRPVLLLHGNPSWSFLWRDLILRLAAQGRRVIAPDHVGMGLSARPDRFLRLADRIADARRIVEDARLRLPTDNCDHRFDKGAVRQPVPAVQHRHVSRVV